jgi:hypothetical protein
MFVQSVDIDWMSNIENPNLDDKGYFLFDLSSHKPRSFVRGLPIESDFAKENDDSSKNSNVKEMPVTLLVPNYRCSY